MDKKLIIFISSLVLAFFIFLAVDAQNLPKGFVPMAVVKNIDYETKEITVIDEKGSEVVVRGLPWKGIYDNLLKRISFGQISKDATVIISGDYTGTILRPHWIIVMSASGVSPTISIFGESVPAVNVNVTPKTTVPSVFQRSVNFILNR